MAYYAFIDEDNIVVEVISGKNEDEALPEGFDTWEEYYETKRDGLTCLRTSYNTYDDVYLDPQTGEPAEDQSKKFRGNFACKNAIYIADGDYFTPAKEFSNWIYDETIGNLGDWVAPIEKPEAEEGQLILWNDEGNGSWDTYEWNSTTEIYEKIE